MANKFIATAKRVAFAATVIVSSLASLACFGDPASIRTGEVGRVLGSRGLEDKVYQPGTFRLDTCWMPGATCPRLVRLQVNKSTQMFSVDHLFLPKNSINITDVQVALQFRVKPDASAIDKVYDEVRARVPEGGNGSVMVITDDDLYALYLQRVAPNAVIAALREHTVDEVLTHVTEISANVKGKINEMLVDSPVEVTEVGFPNGIGKIPPEVTEKMHQLYAVAADRDRRIKMLEADLEVERQRQTVMQVRTANDVANAQTAGVDYDTYVRLRALDGFADAAQNGTSLALGNDAVVPSTSKGGK